jgi:tripartite-type tricarboxylate transporter receptor subunit TctC
MSWIGSPDQDTTVCVSRTDARVKSLADLATTELTMGGSGSGADTAVYPEFFAQFLGMKFKTVKGYPGSNEIFLAMERGEVDGMCIAYDALTRQRLYREKKLNILFQAALKQDPKITSSAPIISDSVTDAKKKEILEFFLARAAIGRPLVAPPDVPSDRLKALQAAFLATMSDATFITEAEKLGLSIDPISGPDLSDLIARIYKTPASSVSELAAILKAL